MELVRKKAEELKLSDYNPRVDLQPGDPEFEKIRNSIKTFGYVDPIIYNKQTGHIVGGHQRYKVLVDEGMKEFDVIEVDLNDTEEKALNIALNKISGEWDAPLLHDLLNDLQAEQFDIEITGFNPHEIHDLMQQFEVEPADEEPPQENAAADEEEKITHQCPQCSYEWSGPAK